MSFKQNLLQKIKIDQLAQNVIASIRPAGTPHHIDKEAMRQLLDIGGYVHEKRRDVDLYYQPIPQGEPERVLVLDNDLSVYATSIDDVVLRKSPYVKEMVNIRNIMKILGDKDVIRSKKEETVRDVWNKCLQGLDLSFTSTDLANLKMDGLVALESGYDAEVEQVLTLFAELIGYKPPPTFLAVEGYFILSGRISDPHGNVIHGPHIIYSPRRNRLVLNLDSIYSNKPENIEHYHHVIQGTAAPDKAGAEVLEFLREAAESRKSA